MEIIIMFIFYASLTEARTIENHSSPLESKIIGGGFVHKIEEQPYIVSLRKYNQHFCTGSLISKEHVLTVAHCVILHRSKLHIYDGITVVAGTTNLKRGGIARSILSIHINRSYRVLGRSKIFYSHSDIALVTLLEQLPFSRFISSINLPVSYATEGSPVELFGWGADRYFNSKENPTYSNFLKKANLTVLRKSSCELFYSDLEIPFFPSQLCAAPINAPGNAAYGDGGSPLTHEGIIVGILSYIPMNDICAPGIYTGVYDHLEYIEVAVDKAESLRRKNNKPRGTSVPESKRQETNLRNY